MTVRIRAHLDGRENVSVTVEGHTVAAAARKAAEKFAGGSPGLGAPRETVGHGRWTQRWTRLPALLHLRRLPPSGSQVPHWDRVSRSGRRLVQVYVDPDASAVLERLAEREGSLTAAIRYALLFTDAHEKGDPKPI